MTNTISHPHASEFKNAETAEQFDALYQQAVEHFAYEFETDEEYEAAGGDGAAHDAVDAFLCEIGVSRPRED